MKQGYIFFIGNIDYWLVGGKNMMFYVLRKNTNIRGKRWKKGGNEEIMIENMIFEKKGGGQKYQLFE